MVQHFIFIKKKRRTSQCSGTKIGKNKSISLSINHSSHDKKWHNATLLRAACLSEYTKEKGDDGNE